MVTLSYFPFSLDILSSLHLSFSTVLTIAVANKHPVITLPTDHIKIFSSTWPDSSPGVTYHYHWRRLFGPKKGNLNGVNDKTISLSHVCYREGGNSEIIIHVHVQRMYMYQWHCYAHVCPCHLFLVRCMLMLKLLLNLQNKNIVYKQQFFSMDEIRMTCGI